MSYSRWSYSQWYTFWCVADEGVVETRDNAKLEVMLCGSYTAAELRRDLEGCLCRAVEAELERGGCPHRSDVDELRNIMNEFLDDVNETYPAEMTIG